MNDILVEFQVITFVSAYADEMAIAHSTRNMDVINASLHPEVDKVVAFSAKAR